MPGYSCQMIEQPENRWTSCYRSLMEARVTEQPGSIHLSLLYSFEVVHEHFSALTWAINLHSRGSGRGCQAL